MKVIEERPRKTSINLQTYFSSLVDLSDLRQSEMAEMAGYNSKNIIAMIKRGDVKLPMSKVGIFAKILHADPAHLMRLALMEYMPETWEIVEETLGSTLLSQSEQNLIAQIRALSGTADITAETAEEKIALQNFVDICKKRQITTYLDTSRAA